MWRELILREVGEDEFGRLRFAPPADERALADLEQALGHGLPAALHGLLAETDGVLADDGNSRFVGAAEEIASLNRTFRTEFTDYMSFDSLLFFAEAGNGDFFAFPISANGTIREDIFAWNHEDDSRTWVAPSLATFVAWWLTGKLKT